LLSYRLIIGKCRKFSINNPNLTEYINFIFYRLLENKQYQTDKDYVNRINKIQSSWKATHYDFLNKLTVGELIKMAGGKKSRLIRYRKSKKLIKAGQINMIEISDIL
jgi:hypothetical protein